MCSRPDVEVGPPYLEHPLSPSVRALARDRARTLVRLRRDEPGAAPGWELSDEVLDEVLDLVLSSAWGTLRVAYDTWDTERSAAAAPSAERAGSGRAGSGRGGAARSSAA